MRKMTCFTVVLFLLATGVVHAGQFGAATPSAKPGQISQEVGYFRSEGQWTTSNGGPFDDGVLTQNQVYLQAGYGLAPLWEGYFRLGGADAELENAFADPEDSTLSDGIMPFVSLGVRGLLFDSEYFDVGAFAQGSYFAPYEDSKSYVDPDFGAIKETLELKHLWEGNVGFTLQGSLGRHAVYAGPVLYFGKGKLYAEAETAAVPGFTDKSDETYELDGNLGGIAGISLSLANYLNLTVEGQYRGEEYSVGASLAYLRFDL